jgi:hypothetical protein
MAKVNIEWEHDVPKKAKELIQKAVEGLWEASEEAVTVIGNISYDQCPLDKHTLRDSWQDVLKPLTNEIGFRFGYSTKYAARLHEHPEYNFKTPGTKAKYLEHPIEQNLGDWQGHFLNKLKQVMK